MKHGHGNFMAGSLWTDTMIALGITLLIAGLFYLIHRKRLASDWLSPVERKNLDYPENEILSRLRQHGGLIAQRDLVDTLPGDMEELAKAIKCLEENGFIQRTWLKEQRTYTVSAQPAGI